MAKRTYNTPEDIAQAVKRFYDGESAKVLALYYKVAEPTIYSWRRKAKSADEPPADLELTRLRAENMLLRTRLLDCMIETGRL